MDEEDSIFGKVLSDYIKICAEIGVEENDRLLKVLELQVAREASLDASLEDKDALPAEQRRVALLDISGNDHLICSTEIRLSDADVDPLCRTLARNPAVIRLDLRYNRISDIGAVRIARFLEESSCNLERVVLSCNEIGAEGGAALGDAIAANKSVKRLRVNGNKMGNAGGMAFAAALQGNSTLQLLDLGDTDQKTESVIALATVLNHNASLSCLNVNNPLLFSQEEETTVHLANMLKVNAGLKEIHLRKQDIRDFGATRLAEKLVHNTALTYLDLSQNRITRDGAYQLSLLLKRDTPLRVLDLGGNRLEDDGAIHLADALTANSRLANLVVTRNSIGVQGLCALAEALRVNRGLTNVYVWGNDLGREAAEAFKRLVDSGRILPKNTDVQPYVVDGVTILAELSHGVESEYYWFPRYGPQSHLYKTEEREEGGNLVPYVKITGSA